MKNKYNLRTLSRALDVLELIEAANEPISLTEIAKTLGEAPPIIYRVLHTFESRDYIRRRQRDKRYYRHGQTNDRVSVRRAMNILRAIANFSHDGCYTSELNKQTGIEEEVITNLLEPLVELNFVEQIDATERFRLSYSIMEIARTLLGNDNLPSLLRPLMMQLRDKTGETVVLYKHRGDKQVAISSVHSLHTIRYAIDVGTTYPIYLGSAGKAALSAMPDEDVDQILGQENLIQMTNYMPEPDAIRKELKRIRELGYAVSFSERIKGAAAVATTLRDTDGKFRASLSITMPSNRISLEELNEMGAMLVMEAKDFYIPPKIDNEGK